MSVTFVNHVFYSSHSNLVKLINIMLVCYRSFLIRTMHMYHLPYDVLVVSPVSETNHIEMSTWFYFQFFHNIPKIPCFYKILIQVPTIDKHFRYRQWILALNKIFTKFGLFKSKIIKHIHEFQPSYPNLWGHKTENKILFTLIKITQSFLISKKKSKNEHLCTEVFMLQ